MYSPAVIAADVAGVALPVVHVHSGADDRLYAQHGFQRFQIKRGRSREQQDAGSTGLFLPKGLQPLRVQLGRQHVQTEVHGEGLHFRHEPPFHPAQRRRLGALGRAQVQPVACSVGNAFEQLAGGAKLSPMGIQAQGNDGIPLSQGPVKIEQRIALLQNKPLRAFEISIFNHGKYSMKTGKMLS